MSIFNEEEFKEGLVSELELFDLPGTQTSVNEVYNEEIRPLSAISGDGPYEFRINAQHSTDYLDLNNCQLYVRLKVHNRWKRFDYRTCVCNELIPAESFFGHRGNSAEQSQHQ